MGFRRRRSAVVNFSTPQEMYEDYNNKKINGILNYQDKMIEQYMEKGMSEKNVALELPTGSGKTLVALLIGEFRRKKNKEKIVYLCPTNQLVYQTAQQAQEKYGIKVNTFTGKISDYDVKRKMEYHSGDAIAVTNYSSLFNTNPFFNDADLLIFDDAHSGENYVVSNWSLNIKRSENTDLYKAILENINDSIDSMQYYRMSKETPLAEDLSWVDKLPNIKLYEKKEEIISIIDTYIEDYPDLKYSWSNIKNSLYACNFYLSWNEILIRPLIPPTLTHDPFSKPKQRLYMSATLGKGGELERIFGVEKIKRLPMVNNWDKKAVGRRFILFPEASFEENKRKEILNGFHKIGKRSLVLVEKDKEANYLKASFKQEGVEVFGSRDIEKSKENFINSENGITILANRFDGIDFPNEECRMLSIIDLPNATHLQEKFLISRMAAAILFDERIKTKIIQALGRCTRSNSDYSVVAIFGSTLTNTLLTKNKSADFPVELQAEIELGYEQSVKHDNIEDLNKLIKLFFERGEDWEEFEEDIISERDKRIELKVESNKEKTLKVLSEISKYEVKYQYAIWKEDYDSAIESVENILDKLSGLSLKGYRGFWNYLASSIYYIKHLSGNKSYLIKSNDALRNASRCTNSINWFTKLITEKNDVVEDNDYFNDIVERIEDQIINFGVRSNNKIDLEIKTILNGLKSKKGLEFEKAHTKLGTILGYISLNSEEKGAPDTRWIINSNLCVVAEDKIYETEEKKICLAHVTQAGRHEKWVKSNEDRLNSIHEIETIFISNSKLIEKEAIIHGDEVWYVNRGEFVDWAYKALEGIKKIKRTFIEKGDSAWREESKKELNELEVTPKHFINFIRKSKLSELNSK